MQPLTEMATYSFQALRCEDLGKTWTFPFLSVHFQEVKTRTFVLFEEGIVRLFFVIYRVVKPDYMSLEIKTSAENGVIIWQGQVSVDYFYSRKLALTDITKGNKSFPFSKDTKPVNFPSFS